MISKIFSLLKKPNPQGYARRCIEEHQRRLVDARRAAQHSAAVVTYHERTISDLRRMLETN